VPGNPGSVAVSGGAVWVALVSGNGMPDTLLKLDPKSGKTLSSTPYPYGIAALAVSPSAVWVVSRRRARVLRADPATGRPQRELRVGDTRGEDVVYGGGALWIATPGDDTVYKVVTATGSVIPISVGKRPRQVALAGNTLYVSNYNSSDVYVIDAKANRVVGAPVSVSVNPFAIAAGGDAAWVTSVPENRVSMLVRDPSG
jgi:YVTN family beta-propeller protein